MSSTYKLTYFDIRGKAEAARLVLAQAGAPYEDIRIRQDKWVEMKPKAPFGHIPILSVDGVEVAGSTNIARFIAERHGLAGDNDLQNAEIGSLMDFVMDIGKNCENVMKETDKEKQKVASAELNEKTLPTMFKTLEDFIKPNFTKQGVAYGSKLTWADIGIYLLIDNLAEYFEFKISADQFPCLSKLHMSVAEQPNIKKWLETRPKTVF